MLCTVFSGRALQGDDGNLQALHDAEGADAKVFSEDGKETVKECAGPTWASS